MYNSNNKQFIFKQSTGKVRNFFYEDNSGLCYSYLTSKNSWSEPVPLQKNLQRPFFAEIDYEDNFHLLYQDIQGSIFYSQINNNKVKTLPVLNSKTPSSYTKFMRLIPLKNSVHFFYVLQHNESKILAHQLLSEETINSPKVVDYVVDNHYPYIIANDKSGNIYTFYQVSDGKHFQLGYKKLIAAQKSWGDFIPITKYPGNCENPHVLVDSKNIIHMCYERRNVKQYEMVYQQKIADKNIWSEEVLIHTSAYNFEDSSIIYTGDKIIIYWVRDDIIYYSSSETNGSTWTKPSRYNFSAGRQLMCMSYKTNSPYEAEKLICNSIPGSYINGFKLAFYNESAVNNNALSAEELKNMLLDGLKLLKANVEELKESNTGIIENVSKLGTGQQNFEKEMIKASVRLNLFDNEINQMKLAISKLEKISERLAISEPVNIPVIPDLTDLKDKIIIDIISNNEFQKISSSIQDLYNEIYNLKGEIIKKKTRSKKKNTAMDNNEET